MTPIKTAVSKPISCRPPEPPPPPQRTAAAEMRNRLDALEPAKGPGPVQLNLRENLQEALERFTYQRTLAGMSDEELAAEIARQDERQVESTTGADRDPEEAADSKWRSKAAWAELNRRELEKPELPADEYAKRLGWLSGPQLAQEEKRLVAAIDDARGGAHTNETDAKALEERLALVHSEQAQRKVDDPKTQILEYYAAVKNLSDPALMAEQAQVQAEYEALQAEMKASPSVKVFAELAKLGPRLAALTAEVDRRGLKSEPPPVEEPKSEPEPEAEPKSEPYTVVAGDMLWLISQRISDAHGGTPSQEQVMADLLALNPLPNPDLIEVGQVLQLPVYP